jgi:hypothetical protein
MLCAMVAALQLAACADFAARLRKHTYPPSFHYITDEQLRSTMWRLAFHARELRARMDSSEDAARYRAEVLSHLEGMELAAADLNRSGWPTNHPLIDANHANLLRDIRMAQAAARREPPNFLLAGTVAGACAYCHPSR